MTLHFRPLPQAHDAALVEVRRQLHDRLRREIEQEKRDRETNRPWWVRQ